eukprot:PLAT10092.3.p1 GENE.PLAT10092.3~~PLAT10092.3.p1  ORF type:complete len:948 (+),score=451.55 PLAT10092.3:217-3060(+)
MQRQRLLEREVVVVEDPVDGSPLTLFPNPLFQNAPTTRMLAAVQAARRLPKRQSPTFDAARIRSCLLRSLERRRQAAAVTAYLRDMPAGRRSKSGRKSRSRRARLREAHAAVSPLRSVRAELVMELRDAIGDDDVSLYEVSAARKYDSLLVAGNAARRRRRRAAEGRLPPARAIELSWLPLDSMFRLRRLQARLRGWLLRKQLAPLRKRFRKWMSLQRELVSTEEHYFNSLSLAVCAFRDPLAALADGSKPLLSPVQLSGVFGVTDTIRSVSALFLLQLAQSEAAAVPSFLAVLPLLTLYQSYINNYHTALDLLFKLAAQPAVAAFLQLRGTLCGVKLNSLLIMPVQRLPRYKLFLDSLLETAGKIHELRLEDDRGLLQRTALSSLLASMPALAAARQGIQQLCSQVNEGARRSETMQALQEMRASLSALSSHTADASSASSSAAAAAGGGAAAAAAAGGGAAAAAVDSADAPLSTLVQPHRRLLHSGDVSLRDGRSRLRAASLLVCNDILLLRASAGKLLARAALIAVTVDESAGSTAFAIRCPDGEFTVEVDSIAAKMLWLRHLSSAQRDVQKRVEALADASVRARDASAVADVRHSIAALGMRKIGMESVITQLLQQIMDETHTRMQRGAAASGAAAAADEDTMLRLQSYTQELDNVNIQLRALLSKSDELSFRSSLAAQLAATSSSSSSSSSSAAAAAGMSAADRAAGGGGRRGRRRAVSATPLPLGLPGSAAAAGLAGAGAASPRGSAFARGSFARAASHRASRSTASAARPSLKRSSTAVGGRTSFALDGLLAADAMGGGDGGGGGGSSVAGDDMSVSEDASVQPMARLCTLAAVFRHVPYLVHKQGFLHLQRAADRKLKRRWCMLHADRLAWCDSPTDAKPKGEVCLADFFSVVRADSWEEHVLHMAGKHCVVTLQSDRRVTLLAWQDALNVAMAVCHQL